MNSEANATREAPLESQAVAPRTISSTQRMFWSVRRELWESRSIYIAPLVVAALILVGHVISTVHLPAEIRAAMTLSPKDQQKVILQHYIFTETLLMGTFLIVAVFYCLDALHGERRDRSILFWKSLPVSDLTTVLSKASIPVVILPLFTFAVTIVTQGIMLLWSSIVLMGSGVSVATLWNNVPFFQMSLGLFNHLFCFHGLWDAPFYGWLLLVSAWARRAPFLWAVLPPLAIGILEKITFNTSYFAAMLQYRFMGSPESSTAMAGNSTMDPLSHLTSVPFLISPGLWFGLALAAAFLVAAVRLRRYRDPI